MTDGSGAHAVLVVPQRLHSRLRVDGPKERLLLFNDNGFVKWEQKDRLERLRTVSSDTEGVLVR